MVESADCFSGGLGFKSQHPLGGSPLSVTSVLGDQVPSSVILGHFTQVVHRHICKRNIHTHKVKVKE